MIQPKALLTLCLLAGLAIPSPGQTNETESKKSGHSVSFVAVGSRSDAYWEGEGSSKTLVMHDPGANPPTQINIQSGKLGKPESVRLSLNSPSERVKVKGADCSVTAKTGGDSTSPSEFSSFTLPKTYDSFTVFWARSPKSENWSTPQQLVLSDSQKEFPPGAVRIINFSDRPILAQRGDKILGTIPPGKKVILKNLLKLDTPENVTLWYQHKGRKLPCFQRSLRFPKNQRLNLTCTFAPKRSKPILSQIFTTST